MEIEEEEVTNMDENGDIVVGYMDIQAMEDACKRKYFDSIPLDKLLLLQGALLKTQAQKAKQHDTFVSHKKKYHLNVTQQKLKDPKKPTKEHKFHGRQTNLQRIQDLGMFVIDFCQVTLISDLILPYSH